MTTQPGPVIPQRYLDALGKRDPIESQRKAPRRVKKLINGLSEKELAARPIDGKWSIKEVLAHLADGEVILGSRVRMVAAQDRPVLIGYDQDAFVANLGIERTSSAELLAAFKAARAVNVALLERLAQDRFARIGLHSERGEESIETMIRMYAGHDRIHEDQIARLKEALRASKANRRAKDKKKRKLAPV
jgi:hypothetical protein